MITWLLRAEFHRNGGLGVEYTRPRKPEVYAFIAQLKLVCKKNVHKWWCFGFVSPLTLLAASVDTQIAVSRGWSLQALDDRGDLYIRPGVGVHMVSTYVLLL